MNVNVGQWNCPINVFSSNASEPRVFINLPIGYMAMTVDEARELAVKLQNAAVELSSKTDGILRGNADLVPAEAAA